jgi:hypoxanthine phosphoribosyltransferase
MQGDIDRILIPQEQIAGRVGELAAQITADHLHLPKGPSDSGITIVPVLTGAMIFTADLIRQMQFPLRIGLLTVSSYPGKSLRTQGSQVLHNQLGDLTGRHVLVVDDILDSGGTIRLIKPMMLELGAASVKTCVLLKKDRAEARATPVDYWGFEIPDEFVVGYGLDYNNYYRNLPDIVTLSREAIARGSAALPASGNQV